MFDNLKEFTKENKRDIIYILILLISLLIISLPKLFIQYKTGIANWDTYLYLLNARFYANMGLGDLLYISPVVPFLISILFRIAGHTYQEAIFNLDVLFYIIGSITLYLILRFKFDENLSLLGSMLYSTFTLLYSWVAVGGNDIPGVSLTLVTIYVLLLSQRKNTYYYLIFPVAAYAFLSRYTAGVMLFAILFYFIITKTNVENLKRLTVGSIAGIIAVSPFLYSFQLFVGTPIPFINQFTGTVSNTAIIDSGYLPDSFYFVTHIPNYLSSVIPNTSFHSWINPMGNNPTIFAFILILFMMIGILRIFKDIYDGIKRDDDFLNTKNKGILALCIILSMICIATIGQISYIITILLFMVILLVICHITDRYDIEYRNYDLLMFSLFVIYLLFQSIISTKNDRYFITVLPFIAYLIINGADPFYAYIKENIHFKISITHVLTTILVIFLIFNSLAFAMNTPDINHFEEINESCQWLEQYYPELSKSTIIYSDNWPAVKWYLNMDIIRAVPFEIEDIEVHPDKFSQILLNNNHTKAAAFYIDTNSVSKPYYPGFKKVYEHGNCVIYENIYLKEKGEDYLSSDEYKSFINNFLNQLE